MNGDAFHPGVYIADELEARGWDDQRLSDESGMPCLLIREIMDGHIRVTRAVSERLESAFGVSAQAWLNLQAQYDAHMHRQRQRDAMSDAWGTL